MQCQHQRAQLGQTPKSKITFQNFVRSKLLWTHHHPEQHQYIQRIEPMIVGRNFAVKLNANIGNSGITIEKKLKKAVGLTRCWEQIRLWFIDRKNIRRAENGSSVILLCLLERCLSTKLWKK
jgi:hypothetical protein